MSSAPPPPPPPPRQLPNRVAVAQMTSSSNRLANYSAIRRLARHARDAGASILFLPECCCFLGESAAESVAAASPLDDDEEHGNVVDYYRALAREFGLWLSLGGIQEKRDEVGGTPPSSVGEGGKKMHNTHVILRDDGSTAGRYRKVHLFDFAAEGLHESRSTEPGDSLVVVPDAPCGEGEFDTSVSRKEAREKQGGTGNQSKSLPPSHLFPQNRPTERPKTGPLGLSICYDLRFPELYQRLRFEKEARVLAVPAAFTETTGRQGHWEVLLRARAIETQCAVVAAAQVGQHNEGGRRRSWGQAMIVDASGKVLAKMKSADDTTGEKEGGEGGDSDDDNVGIIVADLDAAAIEGVREKMPVAEHREAGRKVLGL